MPKTQALRLQEMMAKHGAYPSYTLSLYPVEVKKRSLEKLRRGDLLLLGSDEVKFCLLKEEKIVATAIPGLGNGTQRIEITDLREIPIDQSDSKKYQILLPLLGELQCRLLERGTVVDISHIDMMKVTLSYEDQRVAEGHIVTVEGEIAIMIDACG